MSTTRVRSLKEIKSRLDLMPSDVACMKDVNLCIDDLYEALASLFKYMEAREKIERELLRCR